MPYYESSAEILNFLNSMPFNKLALVSDICAIFCINLFYFLLLPPLALAYKQQTNILNLKTACLHNAMSETPWLLVFFM